ncbi:protein RRP5 homolog isoform X2 [Nilaparvata lugens]|uniref:protein RRP5 homolog isoform X2 n=1 Tax=Nilaparvata lugens TaxID=108931 RepID=UPI00193E70F2|nr:protein RRP5 homolog isoform X2 [Nilaparvata lugens]
MLPVGYQSQTSPTPDQYVLRFLMKLKKNSIQKKKKERRTESTFDQKIVNLFQTVPDKITTFRYKRLTEGLVIAGRVREINLSRLGISLPGRSLAHVDINKISTPYTEQLQSLSSDSVNAKDVAALSDMFQIGELVTVAVETINQNNGKFNVSLSLNPCDVNKAFDSSSLVESVQLIGAIKSVEDHGYVVDVGIKNVVAFLPIKNVDQEAIGGLVVGKLVRAVVTYIKRKTSSASTLTLSIKKDTLQTSVPKTGYSNTNVIPATRIKVHVTKVLAEGLVVRPVKACGDVTGHINLNNLASCWDTTSRFKPGMALFATLLYTIPHANIMYFSLWPQICDANPDRAFHDGALVKNAKVVSLGYEGTNFQLGSDELNAKGLVSISQDGGKHDFKVGEMHTVRVIHYDLMENVYICSMKPELLSIGVYSANDLQVGQIVEGKVTRKLAGKGVNLQVGNVTVFAPHFHLTDFPSMSQKDNVQSPICKMNAVVKAKVLSKHEGNILVTLKPMLVRTAALCNYSDVKVGDCYYGTVKSMADRGIVVWFYNHITGFIPNDQIHPILLKPTFHVGQSIRCYVKEVDPMNGKLILTLKPSILNKGYSYGSRYPLTVIESNSEGFKVKVRNNKKIVGLVPFEHLTDHVMLVQPLKDYFKPGSRIEDAVAYSSNFESVPLFSLRQSVRSFFEVYGNDITTANLHLQKKEVIVPCSVTEIYESGITVDVCIPNLRTHSIPKKNIIGYDEHILSSLSVNQSLLAVPSVYQDDLLLKLNKNKFYDITEVGFGVDLLLDYLKSSKLIQSITLGEKTQGTVSKIKKKTVSVKLPSLNSKVIISKKLCDEDLKEDDSIDVTLLWQSPVTKTIHAQPTGEQPEEPLNGPKVGQTAAAKVVLVEDDFAIGHILEGPFKHRIAFFPVKYHLNDLEQPKLKLFSTVHIIPLLHEDGYAIAIKESKLKEDSQTTGKPQEDILSELLDNVNTYFNKRRVIVHINEVLENYSETPDEEEEETPKKEKKKKKKKKAEKSSGGSLFAENETWEQIPMSGKESDAESENCKSPKKKKKREKNLNNTSNGTFEESIVNGKQESASETENKSPKKNKKKDSIGSSISNFSVQDSKTVKTVEVTSKSKKQLLSNEEVSTTPSKVDKKKKSSVLDEIPKEQSAKKLKRAKTESGNDDSLIGDESKPEKRRRKSSISQLDELDSSVSDTKAGKKEKKRKSSEGDFNSTDSQNNSLTEVEKKPKKKKKSVESNSTENTADSHQDEIKTRLSMLGYEGFSWSVDAKDFSITQGDNDNDSEDEDDDLFDGSAKKGRAQMTVSEKRAAAKEAEQRLRRAEQLLLEAEANPQSVDHFERLVLAHPNSSMLWIKYMALHLQETEIDKARAVAKRALQVMNSREEEDRLNVWTALLNLENLYGSEESLKSALDEAVRTNDDYQVYSKMLEIYADSKNTKSVEQLVAMMSKKFKSKLDCWLVCCRNLMRVGSHDKARSFFQRGLEALAKKDHVQFITRFALLENALGSFDHAQTVMDHVLMTYPGRIPAWTTYVDMLTKSGHIDLARQVLQRSVNQKLPVKKMKTLYKKWLDFEEHHGTQTNIKNVKNLAEQYVNSLSLKIDDIQ